MPNTNLGLLLGGSVERDCAEWVDDGVPVVARHPLFVSCFGRFWRQLSAITSARNGFGFRAKAEEEASGRQDVPLLQNYPIIT